MTKSSITERIKTAYQVLTEAETKKIVRRQYNMMIAYDVVLGVKVLAAALKVPQYILCEHIMELGSNLLLESVKTPEQQQKLKEHLISVHRLGQEQEEDG